MELSTSFRKTLFVGLGVSGLVSVSLVVGIVYISLNNVLTKLVPPTIQKEMTIGRNYVDTEYLSETAEYVVWLRNNVTPDTVTRNFGQLLKMAKPSKWGALRGMLMKEAEIIQHDKVSASFFIKSTSVSVDDLTVKIEGIQTKWVGSRKLPEKKINYHVVFDISHGAISLDSIRDIGEQK